MVNLKTAHLNILVIIIGLIWSVGMYLTPLLVALTKQPFRKKPIKAAFYHLMDPERDYYRQTKGGLSKLRVKELEDRFYIEHGVENYLLTRGNSPRFVQAGKKARRVVWRFFNTDTGDCCPQHIRALYSYFKQCRENLIKLKPIITNCPNHLLVSVDENNKVLPEAKYHAYDRMLDHAINGATYCAWFCDKIDSTPDKRPTHSELERLVHYMTDMYYWSLKLEPALNYLILPPTTIIEGCPEMELMIHWLDLQFILQDTYITILGTA